MTNDQWRKGAQLPKVIYIMGPPGGGKGTQAEMLAKEIGYERFSTGDAFRQVAKEKSDLGRRVKETIENGYLAPPEMAAEIVINAIKQHTNAGKGLIFDGTPRTVAEAKIVDDFFLQQGYGKPLVFYLAIDKEEMMERNSKRKFCLGIKGDFPVWSEADRQKCAALGGKIGTRPDDEPEKFETRWQEFMNQTFPVVESYRQHGIVKEIDGMKSIEDVFNQIREIIK